MRLKETVFVVVDTETTGLQIGTDRMTELAAVKVIDGRSVNGKFWVFYGGLSDVEYRVTVTDTESGASRVYHNPPGEICGVGDTGAL